MAKAIIEIHGHEIIEEEDIIKRLTEGDDSIYHKSEILVKWVDDQEFEAIIDQWLKDNGCVEEETKQGDGDKSPQP